MAKKHVVLASRGTKVHKAASRSLTFVGFYKGGGSLFSDLGIAASWKAYQRESSHRVLPDLRRGHYQSSTDANSGRHSSPLKGKVRS